MERRSWTKPGCCSAHQDLPGQLFQSCCRLVVNIFALINNNCLDDFPKLLHRWTEVPQNQDISWCEVSSGEHLIVIGLQAAEEVQT